MPKKPSQSITRLGDSPRGASEFNLADWPYQRPCNKRELAEGIRSTEKFIELEVRRGHLRAVRLGLRSVRFLPSDIVRWLNARPLSSHEAAA